MSRMLTRNFDFLKNKYRELLLPTLLMLLSDKICFIIDIAVIAMFIPDSTLLSAINLASPFIYFSAVIYTLFGVGGSLLALRAKASQDDEKANYYFTASISGVLIANIIYVIFCIILGDNIIMELYGPPLTIYKTFLLYFNTLVLYFPFNCYILTLGYFVRSDGYPRLPFIALLIANISNIIISLILMGVFNFGVEGSAFGSLIGYALGAAYISKYFLYNNRSFFLTTEIKIRQIFSTMKDFILNTPEIISRIFITLKVIFYNILCYEYMGLAGLMAFLVYDNSETVVYMFLSAIAKVMSPIVAIFYKEKDYEAVEYIVKKSIKHVLIIAIPIGILFAAYPEVFAYIFSLDDPAEIKVICSALRITSVGLIGRSLSLLLSSYAQAIERNNMASVMSLLEEFVIAFGGGILFAQMFGAEGIWYALVVADIAPLVLYGTVSLRYNNKNKDRFKSALLLKDTNTVTWTYIRDNNDPDSYFNAEKKLFMKKIENALNEKSSTTIQTIQEVINNILKDEEIENIDATITYVEDTITITLTYEGKLINPVTSETAKELNNIGGDIEYSPIMGYNRAYINVPI